MKLGELRVGSVNSVHSVIIEEARPCLCTDHEDDLHWERTAIQTSEEHRGRMTEWVKRENQEDDVGEDDLPILMGTSR